jgi:beta-glucosidase-like glycosyl hydrolase/CubicO group peptidase (beta-lactamase class C family)
MSTLSLDQKIAQLVMVRANLDGTYLEDVTSYVRDLGVGGIVWFKSNPTELARRTTELQGMANVPLFVAIDAEHGLGMRIDSAWSFPRNMVLGAIPDTSIIREIGQEIGRQCKALGIQMNFAPVVDINSNPGNPVINARSYGEIPEEVGRRGAAFVKGLQSKGVLGSAKHFPGHGDTDKDSHYTLPVIHHSSDSIRTIDVAPFRQLIKEEVGMVMTAHLQVPAIEPDSTLPFTLSERGVKGLLKSELGYTGLAITDALEMKGVTGQYPAGEAELRAFEAGNDILLMPADVPLALRSLRTAVDSGRISLTAIDHACRKVLTTKANTYIGLPLAAYGTDWYAELNTQHCEALTARVFEQAVTLMADAGGMVPMNPDPDKIYATLALNAQERTTFQQTLEMYGPFDHYNLPANPRTFELEGVLDALGDYSTIYISLHGLSSWPQRNYGITPALAELLGSIIKEYPVVLTVFGNPYALNLLGDLESLRALAVAYEDGEMSQLAAAQVLAGALPARGKLPVSAGGYPAGQGLTTPEMALLRTTLPGEGHLSEAAERRIDSIARAGISAQAYPSCQVLAARNGDVFYKKAFGYQTYDSIMPVSMSDIYDLASVTKVAATTLAVMKLVDEGRIDLDRKLSHYLPELKHTNKKNLVIRDMLAHQARLQSWIPFYKMLVRDVAAGSTSLAPNPDAVHNIALAPERYMEERYQDSLWTYVLDSKLLKKKKYLYGDLSFYLMQRLVEHLTDTPLDVYVDRHFYEPLGLGHTAFKPREVFCLNNILPSEEDTVFRMTTLKGDVHDPGAAMMGGVSGHAGLFSNATDLAVIMQMLVDGGEYRGRRYLSEAVIKEFTRQQFPDNHNRRGLGFDKPDPENRDKGSVGPSPSLASFGHTGFTGTYVWADPENGLVYVFLSNRTWPYGGPNKLAEMNIRTDILEVIYQDIEK